MQEVSGQEVRRWFHRIVSPERPRGPVARIRAESRLTPRRLGRLIRQSDQARLAFVWRLEVVKRLVGLVSGLAVLAAVGCGTGDQPARGRHDPTQASMLRVARSDDGLSFVDTGRIFMPHAAAPDLVRLPDGGLLALFDHAVDYGGKSVPLLAVSRSRDEGRSWSPARLVKLCEPRGGPVAGRHGDLLRMADGTLRLYFATAAERRQPRQGDKPQMMTVIRSAVTKDGIEYRVDERTQVPVPGETYLHPTAVRAGGQVHLYVDTLERRAERETRAAAGHFASRDGRRFTGLEGPRLSAAAFVGDIVRTEAGLRAYVSSEAGVRSLVSEDGRKWRLEPGLRLAQAWDPAVVRLKNGSYLMIYCTAAADETSPRPSPTDESGGTLADRQGRGTGADGVGDATGDASALVAPPTDQELALNAGLLERAGGAELPADALADLDVEDWSDIQPLTDEDGFLARPDFRTKVDYVEWFRQRFPDQPQDNAYPAYDAFMPGLPGSKIDKPEWPELNNMLTDADYEGPPGPWDPARHPDWAASSDAARDLRARFREATRLAGYAHPLDEAHQTLAGPDGEPLLLNLLLPQLSSHRDMVKETIADSWRLEDGAVSAERMLEAWQTCFRNAGHLSSGPTLIEELVSVAERALVQENARWALQHEVFSGEELETALDVLMNDDRGNPDPIRVLRGEHAFVMDILQYLFWPEEPGGQPTFRADRARNIFDYSEETLAELSTKTAQDAREAIDTFDAYYREVSEQMSIGYPDVRAADVEPLQQTYDQRHAFTGLNLMANLGRLHTLRARLEASRRATQLAYATHLFKEQHGRWPETLDELPGEYGYEMTIDPFTGEYFGYRVTESGPTIYSLSENGLDDGGVHARRWADEPTETGSDDHVFWPPQPRR